MDELNDLEKHLIISIIEENEKLYPSLLSRLDSVKVKNREFTGVGSFTFFEDPTAEIFPSNAVLSSRKTLKFDGLENELSYELNLTEGKFDFLEIVTNGFDEWKGMPKNFELD